MENALGVVLRKRGKMDEAADQLGARTGPPVRRDQTSAPVVAGRAAGTQPLPTAMYDREQMLDSLRRLRARRDQGAAIITGHDPEMWKTVPQAPTPLTSWPWGISIGRFLDIPDTSGYMYTSLLSMLSKRSL